MMSKIGVARSNRFSRHPIRTGLGVAVVFLLLIEAASTLLAWGMGHSSRGAKYEPNRIISGYTVYRHSPGFDFGQSTIRKSPDEPSVVFDENGFICDEVITQQKPDGVVRVFLMGGSTAISSGQTDIYSGPHKYPWGIYAYRHSIAGQLRDFLKAQVPEIQVQVITAAAFGRRVHQSLVEYLSTVSRFSPDIVVTLDGMNDLGSLVAGSPWADAEAELPQYIDIYGPTTIAGQYGERRAQSMSLEADCGDSAGSMVMCRLPRNRGQHSMTRSRPIGSIATVLSSLPKSICKH